MSVRTQNLRPTIGSTRAALIAVAAALTLGGCTSLSGLGGESKYACKAPVGVTCDSVSGTYANAIHNNLPGQRQRQSTEASTPTATSPPAASRRAPLVPALAAASIGTPSVVNPLRSQARVLRLWTKPWEDADGDLYDQGYVYVQVDAGQWLIDHVQRHIRDAYAPLRPPPKAAANTSGDVGQSSDSAMSTLSAPRPTSTDTPFQPRLAPLAGTPSGTSFNRTQ